MDKYTKTVLTVIAVALSVIALRGAGPSAALALGECGVVDACEVEITNWPSTQNVYVEGGLVQVLR